MKKVLTLVLGAILSLTALSQTTQQTEKQTATKVDAQKPDTVYALVGKAADFELLYRAILSPDDVSKMHS